VNQNERISAILSCKHRSNIPHPNHPGKRLVGWIVDEDVAGLSDSLFALEEIERLATKLPTKDERQALATMVYEAIRFCDWAAGEGFTPAPGEPAIDPAELLTDYVNAIDGDEYEGLAEAAREWIMTTPAVSNGERK
jgi:hypothetical protein